MINFRQALQDKCIQLAQEATGVGSDPLNYVKAFDRRLRDVNYQTELPFLATTVRMVERTGEAEMGTRRGLFTWTVHFYLLDIGATFAEGEARRDAVVGRLIKSLEGNPRLGNLESIDADGRREYVWDSRITASTFDHTGQDGYESFVSEIYLNVDTAKS